MEQYIVDIILALIFIIFTVVFFIRGFAKTVLDAAAFVGAIIISRSLAGRATDWILKNTRFFADTERQITELIIVVILFFVLLALLSRAAQMINRLFKIPVLKQANQILGGILGAVSGAVLVVILSISLQITSRMVYNARYLNAVKNSVIVQAILPDENISGGVAQNNGGN